MLFSQTFFWCLILVLGHSHFLASEERGSSAPFISGDTFRAYAHHIFDETTHELDPTKVNAGDIIFVKTDWEYLERFFRDYHPFISNPYILLTHNSDHSAPGPFRPYLEDPKLLAWCAQNIEGEKHQKLHPIPIGIANKCWQHGRPEIFAAYLSRAHNKERQYLCYINFHPSTYPVERSYVWDLFSQQPWCTLSPPTKQMSDYLQDLSKAKFVISPRGNGLDCHRTWEALLMGAIPVVRSSSLDPLFADLPVLIIQDWNIVSETFLNEQYKIMKQKSYNLAKLFSPYWIEYVQVKAATCTNY